MYIKDYKTSEINYRWIKCYTRDFRYLIFPILLLLLNSLTTAATLNSPDNRISVELKTRQKEIYYNVTFNDNLIIKDSKLGIQFAGETLDLESWFLEREEYDKINQTWKPVWGKREQVRDQCNQLTLLLKRNEGKIQRMNIVVRTYNDGVAIRYELDPEAKSAKLITATNDLTEFNFKNVGSQAWSYNGEHRPRGPESLATMSGKRRSPMTIKVSDDCYVGLHEAALYNFHWLEFSSVRDSSVIKASIGKIKIQTPFTTPWRVIMIDDNPGALVDSDILINLNPPCEIKDTSWIKTGVSFWDWRAWGNQVKDFTYGLDLKSWKRFVDLANESGTPFLLLDADWYGPEFDKSSDPVKGGKVRDVREIIRYGKEKNVGIFLYLNDAATKNNDLDAVLKNYSEWGTVGIKYGFLRAKGQQKVNRVRQIIKLCAKHKLLCNFHDGPIPPTGDERTWPNCITREFCHSQSDAKRVFTPETYCLQVYVNMLAGPIDMCNGLFDMTHSLKQRPKIFTQLNSTITAEAARTLITYSGLTVLADSADMYRKHPEVFKFIVAQKQPWKESKTLQGEIGEYIVMTRRTSDTWLVGASTNEQAREINLPLDFLQDGEYSALIIEDTESTHYQTNRESYNVRKQHVSKEDVIKIKMAPGGGFCMHLKPVFSAF